MGAATSGGSQGGELGGAGRWGCLLPTLAPMHTGAPQSPTLSRVLTPLLRELHGPPALAAGLPPRPTCPDLALLSDTPDPIGSLHLRISHSTARSRAWPPRRPGLPSPFPTRRLPLSPAPFLPAARLRPGLRAGSRTHRTRRCTRSPRSSPRTSPAWRWWGPSSPRGPPPEPSRATPPPPPPPRRSTGCARLRGLPGRLRPGSRAGFAPRPPAPEGGARCRH